MSIRKAFVVAFISVFCLIPSLLLAQEEAVPAQVEQKAAPVQVDQKASPAQVEQKAAPPTLEDKIKQMDKLWVERYKKDYSQKGLDYSRTLYKEVPDNYDVAWRMARAAFWVAEHSKSDKQMEKLGKEGYNAGLKAIKINSEGIDGYYFGSAALGQYATGSGILKALFKGLGNKYEKMCKKALKIDRRHDWAGPLRAIGRYWYSLPKIKRDLDKSTKYLEEAITVAPLNLRNHAYLADTYLEDDKKAKAIEQYKICAEGDPRKNDYADAILQKKYCAGKLKELVK